MRWLDRWRRRRLAAFVPWQELEDLLSLTPAEFEDAVGAILREIGFRRVKRVGGSGDLSVDLTCRDGDNRRIIVQCKRYQPSSKVGSVEVQKVLGMAKLHHKADQAVIVTTSSFTRPAMALAESHPDLMLVDGLMLAGLLARITAAAGTAVGDPVRALKQDGLSQAVLAARARHTLGWTKPAKPEPVCQCRSVDVRWAGHRTIDGRPILVCPLCERLATPEEVHEAMLHGEAPVGEIPGLEPLRRAAVTRAQVRAMTEFDVEMGLLLVHETWIVRKRQQAAKQALKQILSRVPTTDEIDALAGSDPPIPDTRHVCVRCMSAMPWSRRLGGYWCKDCQEAEFPMADRLIRLQIPADPSRRNKGKP